MAKPKISSDPLYILLREGAIEAFNRRRKAGETCDLRGTDLSRLDLRGLEAEGLDFEDCYFRQSDLRGIDFRKARLEGASFNHANISGCYFPAQLRPTELQFSLTNGTRVRYSEPGKW